MPAEALAKEGATFVEPSLEGKPLFYPLNYGGLEERRRPYLPKAHLTTPEQVASTVPVLVPPRRHAERADYFCTFFISAAYRRPSSSTLSASKCQRS